MKRKMFSILGGVLISTSLLSACGVGADAYLTAEDAKQGTALVDKANTATAEIQFDSLFNLADAYKAESGSLKGFAASVSSFEPGLAETFKKITDQSALLEVTPGSCLTGSFTTHTTKQVAC